MLRNKRAQSTVEYLILVAAVIAVILAFAGSSSSPFRTTLNSVLQGSTDIMSNMSNRLNRAYPSG